MDPAERRNPAEAGFDVAAPAPYLSEPVGRRRYFVLTMLCLLAMLTYLDRAVASQAKGDIMAAVGRPADDFYLLLVAFQLAYALFEVPTGWMGDTFGPRRTLLRIVIWWSTFMALTGLAGLTLPGTEIVLIGFVGLIVVQFCFGAGEAGAFPNITRALFNWFPSTQRGQAQGLIWMSARLMGGLTPLAWLVLSEFLGLGWRQILMVFAGLAAAWCVWFYVAFRNRPEDDPKCGPAERDRIAAGRGTAAPHHGVPWKKLLRSRNLWCLCLMYTVTNFNWYFLMYYLPGFFKGEFAEMGGSNGGKVLVALMGGAPLLLGMLGCYLGGTLSDRYIRVTGDRRRGRRIFGMLGYAMAGVCYLVAASLAGGGDPWMFAGALIFVGFFNDLIMGPAWATCQDVGRRYSAIVAGFMNMVGNIGSTTGIFVTGRILKADPGTSGFQTCFVMYACVYGLGVLAWLLIRADRPIVPEEGDEPARATS